ncbi:synaptonemal complex central element protein 2 [Kryptolebias marmoratus]|uniref:synaptonemal complex central element protein 2 n=1 Tax=Kryptolebias marmoratus TaxID=37003 RepID=UPI0007F88616|nr:synaptonemal complex central element protein 2 [Kryptolebias marmoratus]
MDFFFEDLPSTSQSTPKKGQGDCLATGDTDCDSPREKSSGASTTEVQEEPGSSSVDDISRRAQEMVEKINRSRTSDQDVMDGFQEKLTEKVTEMCRQMKEHMYALYERNSDEMQVKLQELSEVLDSCTKLNQELLEASQALTLLREGLGLTQPSNQ